LEIGEFLVIPIRSVPIESLDIIASAMASAYSAGSIPSSDLLPTFKRIMQHSFEDAVKFDLLPNLRTAIQRAIILSAVLQVVDKTTGPDL
jgi:hypothetical protein